MSRLNRRELLQQAGFLLGSSHLRVPPLDCWIPVTAPRVFIPEAVWVDLA